MRVKAEYIIVFCIGIVFLAIGVYGAYYLFDVALPSGKITNTLPLAIVGCSVFGVLMILKSYLIFIPIKKNSYSQAVVCPFCGALLLRMQRYARNANSSLSIKLFLVFWASCMMLC